MRYHIFHLRPDDLNFHDWDVTEDFVNQIAQAFLRGRHEVTITGEKYSVGANLLIYENQQGHGLGGALMDSIVRLGGTHTNYSKDFFEKEFKNVTDRFTRGLGWGDLKEDFYNIYINDGQSKSAILVLSEYEVQDFLDKWAKGENPIWVSGTRIDLTDPESIKIYDISFDWLSKDRGNIKFNIKKYTNLVHKGNHKIDTFEHFGKDITDKWNIKPYGRSKNKISGLDWAIIHSEIYRVANPRFKSGHYADAVESSFKEINDIIKKEYKIKEGKEEDGTSLMRKAFAHKNPVFKLTDMSTDSLKSVQKVSWIYLRV